MVKVCRASTWAGLLGILFGLGTAGAGDSAVKGAAGALVRMQMDSSVGVLLDEIPAGPEREAAVLHLLAEGDDFWAARAGKQVELTNYRLVFRQFYYRNPKGALPLPPSEVRHFDITGAPRRAQVDGHDYVLAPYSFSSYIVTDAGSPASSEPKLGRIGGSWDEAFALPEDPELLLQRTGFACMDEYAFPPGSVFEENTAYYYDQTCPVETPATAICHVSEFPSESCTEALTHHVGMVSANMHFTRVAYDPALAGRYRVGIVTNGAGADLAVITGAMQDEHRIVYRYFTAGDCEIAEGSIAAPGWRRLLEFSANVRNDGSAPIHIGDLTDPANPWVRSNVFEYSACHNHFHFHHYADFGYGGAQGLKQAFCLEDTSRVHNDETTGLTGVHQDCSYQGIQQGWGDEYQYGISGQWVDITNQETTRPHDLTFHVNPDQFLCEGQTLGVDNQPVDPTDVYNLAFDPTGFVDDQGRPVTRVRCNFPSNYADDNVGTISVSAPAGSFVTDPCTRGQIGPNRDCGFDARPPLRSCTPGSTVTLHCTARGPQQVLRLCEISEVLQTGVACTVRDSVANAMVSGSRSTVSFTCPAVRDSAHGAGGYSVYSAPLLPWEDGAEVECSLTPSD